MTTISEDAGGSIEVRDSEQDVTMKEPSSIRQTDAEDKTIEDGEQRMYQIIQTLTARLSTVQEDGEELAAGFQRIPNRRVLPDYFDVITDPVAFSTIRGKLQKKQYTAFSEFVKDVAKICHNAQVYNRPSAPIFGAAVRLREIFREDLHRLVTQGDISTDDSNLPDLGELPPVEDSPSLRSQDEDGVEDVDEDEDEDDEDEDEDEDEESSDDDEGLRKRRRKSGREQQVTIGRRDRHDRDDDAHKKRGRPPMLQTPTEGRISSILRGLRKFRDGHGRTLILPFERLPDKTTMAEYYQTISNPIALDNIKKKAKRKKYRTVDELQKDIELMLENAKLYNEDDSTLYLAAVELQDQSRLLVEQEKAKPDADFADEDGKLPLNEVQHDEQIWKIGDWVHIRNPNDLAKPIVAQIFRIWQDNAGQKWINACWYYRPEQTVHRHEKHFFEHEVVKTGQYRDHQISEVLDRCFVMFVTRFNRGRPRGLPSDKDVYVCESRYNEERFRFNKIKTWASCVPDEVRDKDYEMDLFDMPRRMKKLPSPIKHLLREDVGETDELPRPTWGSPNAPPIVGAVHRRPPEPNESPPPESTPPPLPPMSAVTDMSEPSARPMLSSVTADMTMDHGARGQQTEHPAQSSGLPSSPGQFAMPVGHYQAVTSSTASHVLQQTPVPVPQPPQAPLSVQVGMRQVQQQQQQSQQGDYIQNFQSTLPQSTVPFQHHQASTSQHVAHYNQQRPQYSIPNASSTTPINIYNPPRPPEVYTLPDHINDALHDHIKCNFQQDNAGRVLFFAGPPLDRPHKHLAPQSASMGHSVRYLAGREAWLLEREKKRKRRSAAARNSNEQLNASLRKREEDGEEKAAEASDALNRWFLLLDQRTLEWQQTAGLHGWEK